MSGDRGWLTGHNAKGVGCEVGLEERESVWAGDRLAANGIEGYDEKARMSAARRKCNRCDRSGTYRDRLCESSSRESREDDGVTHCEGFVGIKEVIRGVGMSIECGILL